MRCSFSLASASFCSSCAFFSARLTRSEDACLAPAGSHPNSVSDMTLAVRYGCRKSAVSGRDIVSRGDASGVLP
jgi:hypothetical protein